jgi:cytochrome c biogenesis protein CcmG, thiol:disulfide interchange protein DsbE
MKKKILLFPFIVFSLILLIFFYLLIIERNPKEIPSMLSNQKAPSFEAESLFLNEKFISEEVFKNKIIIVNFFATWCKPCRDEHGYIKLLSKKNKIHIIGINYKDKNEKTVEWLKKLGNPYSRIAIDKKGNIAIDWGVYGIPETFIVNSNGIIKFRHVGQITEKIYKKINLFLAEIE